MKTLEKGQDKIQKICEKLRHETLEPAQKEAQKIIEEAQRRSEEIITEAEKRAEQLIRQARGSIEQERNVFRSSLQQASKQALEALRQDIEHRFFSEELQHLLEKPLSDPTTIAALINSIVKSLEKDGIATDFSVVIPKSVSAEAVNELLLDAVRKRLKGHPIELGSFTGGIQVKLHGKKMTLDLSDQALKEILATYMRKDFRQMIFSH